jgi:arsenate reductase (thioredoxin)
MYNVLFLCTGNSVRSIMAEAILNHKGKPNFLAHSAASHPAGQVRPEALKQLELANVPIGEARSKSWDEFARLGAPKMDFVITVCDNAAKEVCPIWPGHPIAVHWSITDPASVKGSGEDVMPAFREAFLLLDLVTKTPGSGFLSHNVDAASLSEDITPAGRLEA